MNATLERTTFATNRAMEFSTETHPGGNVQNGALARMHWPQGASPLEDANTHDFYNFINLGPRYDEVDRMNLQSEPVEYESTIDPRINLRLSGATEDECKFLVQGMRHGHWFGERVELNAMTSDQFLSWLAQRLADTGVVKLVPAEDTLRVAYRQALQRAYIQKAVDAANAAYDRRAVTIPNDLAETIRQRIAGTTQAWDDAIFALACEQVAE